MVLSSSEQNADMGDEEAMVHKYDVKLVWLVERFDVWARTDNSVLMNNVGSILIDPRFKSDHHNVKSYGKALPLIVDWVWACFHYIKKSKDMKPKKNALDDVFWAALYNMTLNPHDGDTEKFYDVLLPFLTGKPLEASLLEAGAASGASGKVIAAHSASMVADGVSGAHARRPHAYAFAAAKTCPV